MKQTPTFISALLFLWFLAFCHQGLSQPTSKDEVLAVLEDFLEKPVQDQRDPLVHWFVQNPEIANPWIAEWICDLDISCKTRAWLAFFPSLASNTNALIPAVLQALRDPYWRVRYNAANTLGRLRCQDAAALLVDLLHDSSPWVQDAAQDALNQMPHPPYAKIRAMFHQSNADTQQRLRLILGNPGAKYAHPTLEKAWELRREKEILCSQKIYYLDIQHYRIYTTAGWDFAYETAIRMERAFASFHRQFLWQLGLAEHAGQSVVGTIYIFQNATEFEEYSRHQSKDWLFLRDAGAYYIPAQRQIVGYLRDSAQAFWPTLYHEMSHQILHRYIPDIPVWLDEGLAECYCDWQSQGQLQIAQKHLAFLQQNFLEGTFISLQDLVELDDVAFHSDFCGPQARTHYAQSWSLVHFLLYAEHQQYRPILKDYVLNCMEKTPLSFSSVLQKHNITIERLQHKWQAYLLGNP